MLRRGGVYALFTPTSEAGVQPIPGHCCSLVFWQDKKESTNKSIEVDISNSNDTLTRQYRADCSLAGSICYFMYRFIEE